MNMDFKAELAKRLDKYASRETVAMIMTGLGLMETQASPELWTLFGLVATAIFRLSKVAEGWIGYKKEQDAAKLNTTVSVDKVSSVTDTQDTPTDGAAFR